jgi:hypothetical protein
VAQKPTVIGLVAKWLLAPAAMLAGGYFVVGPRLGDDIFPAIGRSIGQPILPTDTPAETAAAMPEPEIEVTVRRASYQPSGANAPAETRRAASTTQPRRSSAPAKAAPATEPEEPPITIPVVDPVPPPVTPPDRGDGDSDGQGADTDTDSE